jgi:hypothetical protein
MLMVSELAEAMEGHRKGLMDDKLPHRTALEVELADCLIRILDAAHHWSPNFDFVVMEKLEYNKKREDHTDAARLKKGGKKY